ncbi:MAG: amidohydrolase [Phycisphaerae bacterium]|nr:amidohydrolase [Phycisphaerae bacterium]
MCASQAASSLSLVRGRIWTGDLATPSAESLTVLNGRVVFLDAPSRMPTIDLDGAFAMPGLIDAHLHLALGGETLLDLDLSEVRSRPEFERAVLERHRTLAPGQWLLARGWNEDAFADGSVPDRTWLHVAGDRPVVAWRMDMHSCVVNEVVLAMLDLAHDPPGGRIVRDATLAPTGLLQEAAAWTLVSPRVPSPGADAMRRAVRLAQDHLARLGLTGVGSMEYAKTLQNAIVPERDHLLVRMYVTLLDRDWPLDLRVAQEFRSDDMLAVIGMKAFVDGTLGSRTARMLEDYADDPGNRGLLVELAERGVLNDWAAFVRGAGLSPSMHAIGDEAVRLALDACDLAEKTHGVPARVEHAQTVAPEDLPRFRGRFASMQPLHKAYDAVSAESRLGSARMNRFFPFRSLARAGARLAFGSDWPIVSADPIAGMRAAITGLDVRGRVIRPEENLSVEECLFAYTRGAATCLGMRDCGVLRPGSHGDITILDRDPRLCDWSRETPRVLGTIVAGRVTFLDPSLQVL